MFKGGNWHVASLGKKFNIAFSLDIVQARSLKLCDYNFARGLHFRCQFDDLVCAAKSQACQKYKLQILLFRFLSAVVLTLYGCYIH